MDEKGMRVACLYSYGCQRTKIFKADKVLLEFLKDHNPSIPEIWQIQSILQKLEPWPFYQKIAAYKNGRPLDEKVVRIHWLGTSFFGLETNKDLIHNFLVLRKIRGIGSHLPKEILESMINCLVSFGKVIKIKNKEGLLKVEHQTVLFKKEKFRFDRRKEEIGRGFVEEVNHGELVSIHWGLAREVISGQEAETLERVTREIL